MRLPISVSLALALGVGLAILFALACSGRGTPPPSAQQSPPGPQVPDGHVLVTVSAASQPPGATVTGGGAMLGRTPLTTQVPVPAPRPGETQTFEFTFQLPGYRSQTITASPVNNTLTLNVLLQPELPTAPESGPATPSTPTPPADATTPSTPTTPTPPTGALTHGSTFSVQGRGGGPIVDFSQAVATANVEQNCVIGRLDVTAFGSHTFNSDLTVLVIGPDGQRYELQRRSRANPFRRHHVRRARGRTSRGTWQLIVRDDVRADSGELRGWRLDFACQ